MDIHFLHVTPVDMPWATSIEEWYVSSHFSHDRDPSLCVGPFVWFGCFEVYYIELYVEDYCGGRFPTSSQVLSICLFYRIMLFVLAGRRGTGLSSYILDWKSTHAPLGSLWFCVQRALPERFVYASLLENIEFFNILMWSQLLFDKCNGIVITKIESPRYALILSLWWKQVDWTSSKQFLSLT